MARDVISGIDSGVAPAAGGYVAGDVSTAWTALPAYQNAWADKGGAYQTGQYSRTLDHTVQLRGVVTGGTKAAGTLITTLPVGFRPAATEKFNVVSDVAAGAAATLEIASTGAVTVGPNIALTAASDLSLSGIRFTAAN